MAGCRDDREAKSNPSTNQTMLSTLQVRLRLFTVFLGACCASSWAVGQGIPTFPGADGAGAGASGGRGGIVYHVTRVGGEGDGNRNGVRTLGYGVNDANFPKDANGKSQTRAIV